MPDNGLPFFRRDFPGIGQVYLMMQAGVGKIVLVSVLRDEPIHERNCSRLVVERAFMHDLHAESFLDRQVLCFGTIKLLLPCCCFYSSVEVFPCYEIRQTNDRYPAERRFVTVIDSFDPFLPPEAFQRRDYIIIESFDLVV